MSIKTIHHRQSGLARQGFSQSGFTLMEVLVAMTLFSLITVLLASSFYFASQSRDASLGKVDMLEDKRLAYRIFKRYLETAQPIWRQQGVDKSLLFSGTVDELIFVSAMLAHLGDAGLYQIRLRIIGEQGKRRLEFERRLLHPDRYAINKDQPATDTILIDGRQNLKFSYFGSIDKDEDASWYTDWPATAYLPALVQLDIEGQSGKLSALRIGLPVQLSALTPTMKDYPDITEAWDDD